MKPPKLPAVILVREGSHRLHEKWKLRWFKDDGSKTTLVENAIRQVLKCKYVDQVFFASDSLALVNMISRGFGPGTREPYTHNEDGLCRVETVLRPRVSGSQKSLDGLRWVLEQQCLQASYCMLVQATFPFINHKDLNRLYETWTASGRLNGMFLSKPNEPSVPSGCAWIVNPYAGYVDQSLAPASGPCIDIDHMSDYEAAVKLWREKNAALEDTQ